MATATATKTIQYWPLADGELKGAMDDARCAWRAINSRKGPDGTPLEDFELESECRSLAELCIAIAEHYASISKATA